MAATMFEIWATLKRHCHAILQLYKRLEGAFALVEFQTNDLVLLLNII